MKRSQINQILKETLCFLDESSFNLPEWSTWKLKDWGKNRELCSEIFSCNLGWDITEGAHSFDASGMILFTIRNGEPGSPKSYCEKIIVMKPGQVCPYHYHVQKTEDIINRSQADMVFNIYKATDKDKSSENSFSIQIDGVKHMINPNEDILLKSGQSLTLPPFYTHSFRPVSEKILIGEVSTVNDDYIDNIFDDPNVQRFPKIEEDAEILFPIVGDYKRLGLC